MALSRLAFEDPFGNPSIIENILSVLPPTDLKLIRRVNVLWSEIAYEALHKSDQNIHLELNICGNVKPESTDSGAQFISLQNYEDHLALIQQHGNNVKSILECALYKVKVDVLCCDDHTRAITTFFQKHGHRITRLSLPYHNIADCAPKTWLQLCPNLRHVEILLDSRLCQVLSLSVLTTRATPSPLHSFDNGFTLSTLVSVILRNPVVSVWDCVEDVLPNLKNLKCIYDYVEESHLPVLGTGTIFMSCIRNVLNYKVLISKLTHLEFEVNMSNVNLHYNFNQVAIFPQQVLHLLNESNLSSLTSLNLSLIGKLLERSEVETFHKLLNQIAPKIQKIIIPMIAVDSSFSLDLPKFPCLYEAYVNSTIASRAGFLSQAPNLKILRIHRRTATQFSFNLDLNAEKSSNLKSLSFPMTARSTLPESFLKNSHLCEIEIQVPKNMNLLRKFLQDVQHLHLIRLSITFESVTISSFDDEVTPALLGVTKRKWNEFCRDRRSIFSRDARIKHFRQRISKMKATSLLPSIANFTGLRSVQLRARKITSRTQGKIFCFRLLTLCGLAKLPNLKKLELNHMKPSNMSKALMEKQHFSLVLQNQ